MRSEIEIELRPASSPQTPPQLVPLTPPQQLTPPSRRSGSLPGSPAPTARAAEMSGFTSGPAGGVGSSAAGATGATAPLQVREDADGFLVEGRRGGEDFSVSVT